MMASAEQKLGTSTISCDSLLDFDSHSSKCLYKYLHAMASLYQTTQAGVNCLSGKSIDNDLHVNNLHQTTQTRNVQQDF